jgi:hypothetical protein
VILGNLEPDPSISWPLFSEDQKLIRLSQAIDQANRKFGAYSLYFAGMDIGKPKSDPRIAFNYIPNLEIPGV